MSCNKRRTGRIPFMDQSDTNGRSITPHQPLQPSTTTQTPSGRLDAISRLVLALVLIPIFGIGLFAGWTLGRESALPGPQQSTTVTSGGSPVTPPVTAEDQIAAVREAVLAKVRPSVVQVNVVLSQGMGIGSGVILDKRGFIVTNNHVIAGARRIEVVLFNGTKLTAQLAGTDPVSDLALLKITPPTTLTVATFGDSSK